MEEVQSRTQACGGCLMIDATIENARCILADIEAALEALEGGPKP